MPLAIELAAGWLSVMTIAELDDVVAEQIGALADIGGGDTRHGTVAATVEWSYGLLEPAAQAALRRLAVFTGGFTANGALAVVEDGSLRMLARLVDMSLVVIAGSTAGTTRYRLLEPVREYAGHRLTEAGELDAARGRHFTYFLSLAEVARQDWLATGQQRVVNELDADYENVRAALGWVGPRDPCTARSLLSGTRDLFFRFGQADGLQLARQLLDGCPKRDALRIETQIAAGQLAITLTDFDTARTVLADARRLSESLEDRLREAWVSFFQGLADTLSGAIAPGREHLETSRKMHRELHIGIGEARATSVLGGTYVMAGELDRGRELLEQSLEICRREDDRWGQGQAHTFLGLVAEDQGGERSAASHYRQAVSLLRPSRDATLLPVVLIGQAAIVVRRDPSSALRILAAAVAVRARVGGELAPFYRARLERVREQAVRRYGGDVDAAWAQGRHLDVDDAVDLAFGTSRRISEPTDAGLSARELEVCELVADGLANKAIAARLQLSPRTVESHVRHALTKLGLDNRTQLATWVQGRGQ
jgi:DNA-binding CsgD family transcriptional regulator